MTDLATHVPDTWRGRLAPDIPEALAREIDNFEQQIALKRAGKLADPVFAEMRLRRGVYGQRYDNGRRNDGSTVRDIPYPSGDLLKGPDTRWDAPGMQRIKLPFGAVTMEQLEVLADLADEYADGVMHVTTRQDFQLHFVHIDDTPDLMRRLAAVGVTTAEACGNVVRNVTACPLAGVCLTETFDVTRYAHAVAQFLLGHPDSQDFGRKVKISFSGCADQACGLVRLHDIGGIARTRIVSGEVRRGFELYVGGGLGAVPHQASLFDEFLAEEELLPICQSIGRVFARLGEKKNRARARLKFLVTKLGIDEFRRLVLEERAGLPPDGRWTEFLEGVNRDWDGPRGEGATDVAEHHAGGDRYRTWRRTNVRPQRQDGYSTVTVALPLGDLTSDQARAFSGAMRRIVGDTVRTTVEQNLLIRWVANKHLPALHDALDRAGLAAPGAGTIVDVTSCPGTDTCKLGIASSRGLAGELRVRLAERLLTLDPVVRDLRIKVSGCFNSCGQHHAADIGFWGVNRKKSGRMVPHFQVVLGGQWSHNVAAYGVAVGAVPAHNIPAVLDRITDAFIEGRRATETFQDYVRRMGKPAVRAMIEDLYAVPDYDEDPRYYSDWGDPREFTIGDMAAGECAGQVVSPVDFALQASEREVFAAQHQLDQGDPAGAADIAYRAMLLAAGTLARTVVPQLGEKPQDIVNAFRIHFHDTKLFHDPFAKGKFARYLFRIHEEQGREWIATPDAVRRRIEEAQLFIEAAHGCNLRLSAELLA